MPVINVSENFTSKFFKQISRAFMRVNKVGNKTKGKFKEIKIDDWFLFQLARKEDF